MAITNGYCTLAELKAALAIDTGDTVDDAALELAIESSSRMIDDYCDRFFYRDGTSQSPVARYYTPIDMYYVQIDDIVTITEIATDENLQFSWDTVWTTTDFMVEPINNPRKGWPYNKLLAVGAYIFIAGMPQSLRVRGIWGWSAVPKEIQTACLIQSSRMFLRRQSPFGIAGSPELGTVRLLAKLDADVEALIKPLRRFAGMVK